MSDGGNARSEKSPSGPYLLAPVPSQHIEESRRLILAAAEAVHAGRAVVLGAGRCEEIPLAQLAARFAHVTLNDVDAELLQQGVAAADLDEPARARIDVHVADLTGVTDTLVGKIDAALAAISDPQAAIEEMARLVDAETVFPMPIDGPFELVVASCVLSQLHFALVHRCGERFDRRFPDSAEQLRASQRWTTAVFAIARRMEARLIECLVGLLAPGGVIYLSESPQMCYVKLTANGRWATEGTYRMLRARDISDYVDRRLAIVAHGRWHWVVSPPRQAGEVGRLFDVQALILRAANH